VIYYGLPIILASAAAVCGFFVMRLITTNKKTRIAEYERSLAAVWLTILIPAIAAGSVIVPTLKEYQSLYVDFPFFRLLWVWTLASFTFGIFMGWGYCRPTD
jgi:hypothetical protein